MIRKVMPERLDSRERYRHDHDQNQLPDLHGRESSFRAQAELDQVYENTPKAMHQKPRGELSYEEQYRTDGEARNFRGQVEEDRFAEYPRYGKSMNRTRSGRNYAGIGPKGYKRSDERIEEEVCDVLARDQYINASELIVSVENGVVTLSGTVDDREDRFASEMLVETVLGVTDINNNIKVKKQKEKTSENANSNYH